jgi:nucleotide-binding universal stress UspA family protein
MLTIKHILVPVDGSEPSKHAFQVAASLAEDYDADLAILYVVPTPTLVYLQPSVSYLDHLREELSHIKPGDPKTHVLPLGEGNPASAIVNAARETKCDLIVIGTHRRKGLHRLLLGSVAEDVVRQAPCPVLTVRAQASAKLIAP